MADRPTLPETELEITPEMIEAGRMAYYENSGEGWSNPGDTELCAMLKNVFEAMWSSLPTTATNGETISSPLS
jgi:hypothetical protein